MVLATQVFMIAHEFALEVVKTTIGPFADVSDRRLLCLDPPVRPRRAAALNFNFNRPTEGAVMTTPTDIKPDTKLDTKPDASLDAYWMPFTSNRQFKKAPRLLTRSSGMHYFDDKGREILDAVSGMWCVNAGHARPKIVKAIQDQAAELDYAPPFQMAHPKAFELADKLVKLAPEGMGKVFFTNSGSEAVDTALKIAIAYHRLLKYLALRNLRF